MGYALDSSDELADPEGGGNAAFLGEAARQQGVWFVGGSVLASTPKGFVNRAQVIDPQGQVVERVRVELYGPGPPDRRVPAREPEHRRRPPLHGLDGTLGGDDLLHELEVEPLGEQHAARARDRDTHRRVAYDSLRAGEELPCRGADVGVMALVVGVDQPAACVDDGELMEREFIMIIGTISKNICFLNM